MNLRAVLRLFRIPNVFTAFANVVAGVGIARGGHWESRDLALVAASGALYLAGMVWNDYWDRHIDAEERPERPIPAGEITPQVAAAIGGGLLAVGLGLAAWHGPTPWAVAIALTITVLLYDARLKGTVLGPWAMGLCRALNIGLGLSVAWNPAAWTWLLPLTLFVFTLLITRLSRFEVGGTSPQPLRSTVWGFLVLALLLVPALAWVFVATRTSLTGLLLSAAACAWVLVRGYTLYAPLLHDVTPRRLGQGIGGGILLMPALDAAFVAGSGAPLMATVVFALAGPAYLLKRWYYLTKAHDPA